MAGARIVEFRAICRMHADEAINNKRVFRKMLPATFIRPWIATNGSKIDASWPFSDGIARRVSLTRSRWTRLSIYFVDLDFARFTVHFANIGHRACADRPFPLNRRARPTANKSTALTGNDLLAERVKTAKWTRQPPIGAGLAKLGKAN